MKYFGTDGIRGIANKNLSIELSVKVGKALGIILEKNKKSKVLIGCDNRISKDLIKFALISGLLSFNVDIVDCGIITTPGLSYLTKLKKFDLGIMISASHNSYEYNGIKIFNNKGEKIDNNLEDKIEYLIDNISDYVPYNYKNIGNYTLDNNIKQKYLNFLKKQINFKKINFKIIIDCSNGASIEIIKTLFKNYKNVKIINTDLSGKNINYKCGATDLSSIQKLVTTNEFLLGFSLDGDADRIILTNSNGKIFSGDEILFIISKYYKSLNKLKNNAISITIISNYGLDLSLKNLNIKTFRCDVGDKNVYQNLVANNLVLGGEQSGHIILRDKSPCGDGILNIITLLNILTSSNLNINEYLLDYKSLHQETNNIKFNDYKMIDSLLNSEILNKKIEEIENELGEDGRLLIRKSGTEPVIRILVETKNVEYSKQICEKITNIIKNGINFIK